MDIRTTSCQFHPCNPQKQNLFSGMADIPILDVLERSDYLLNAAEELILREAEDADNDRAFALYHLTQFSRAILSSVIRALMQEEREKSHE